mgnify:FL=1
MQTYKVEDKVYDVSKLGEKAQLIFAALVQVTGDKTNLEKQLFICQSAITQLTSTMNEELIDDALVNQEDLQQEDS